MKEGNRVHSEIQTEFKVCTICACISFILDYLILTSKLQNSRVFMACTTVTQTWKSLIEFGHIAGARPCIHLLHFYAWFMLSSRRMCACFVKKFTYLVVTSLQSDFFVLPVLSEVLLRRRQAVINSLRNFTSWRYADTKMNLRNFLTLAFVRKFKSKLTFLKLTFFFYEVQLATVESTKFGDVLEMPAQWRHPQPSVCLSSC